MRRIAGFSLALLLCGACDTATKATPEPQAELVSIACLKSLGTGGRCVVTRDLTVRGTVTANDLRGEFPRTLVVEDATGGLSIAVDRTALADLFPLGCELTVHCTGLALGDYGGKIRLGARPTGDYDVDRIDGADLGRYLRCTNPNNHLRRPRTALLADVGPADADRYVRFEGVRFVEAGAAWCAPDPDTGERVATLRTLIDDAGRTFAVRTLPSAHYAAEPLPSGKGSVSGIVDYFNGELSLRVINYEADFFGALRATPATHPTACP